MLVRASLSYGVSEVPHLVCALFVPYVVEEGEGYIDMAEEENVLKWKR